MAAAAIIAATSAAQAQGVYARLGAGFSFPAGSQMKYNRSYESGSGSSGSTSKSYDPISFSLGKGVNTALAAGYMFNQYIGLELGAGFLIGLNNTTTDKRTSGNETTESTTGSKGRTLTLTPALRIAAPLSDKVGVYARAGVILPLLNQAIESKKGSGEDKSEQEYKVTGFFTLGCNTAVGIELFLSEKVSIFGELNTTFLRFDTKDGEITVYKNSAGKDLLEGVPAEQKKAEFTKEYNSSATDDKRLSESYPASSVGLTLGIAFKF